MADLDEIAVGDKRPGAGSGYGESGLQGGHLGHVGPVARKGELDRIGGARWRREADRGGECVAAVGLGALRDRQINGGGA